LWDYLVTKHTDGLMKLDIKEKLYGPQESVLAAGDGRVPMASQLVPWAGTYPLLDFGALPLFFSAPPIGYFEWSEAWHDPEMRALLDQYTMEDGFMILGGTQSAPNSYLWGNKAIRTVEDFQGVKARTSGLTQTLALQSLGGSPITLSIGEVEEALNRGTVDAITTSVAFGFDRGLDDLTDFVSGDWGITPIFPSMVVVNVEAFNELDPWLQARLVEAGQDLTNRTITVPAFGDLIYNKMFARVDTQLTNPESGELDRAAALMGPVVEEWLEAVGPLGPDVLAVAAKHANGPARDIVLSTIGR
jgi:TRAP-type C4-dicarboxylate transport system substrate-binding protein